MIFGYTLLDPVFVMLGSMGAMYLLLARPNRLMLYLPGALSVYAFVPFVSLLTLAEIVPMLILLTTMVRGRIDIPRRVRLGFAILVAIFVLELTFGLGAASTDMERTLMRSMQYVGLLMLFLFSLNSCRDERTYRLLVRGAAIIAAIHAIYGLYQFIAAPTGLPMRGILRGTEGAQAAMEGIFLRINGFASEPKRLGYVLAVGALAFFELARHSTGTRRTRLRQMGIGVLAISLLTFSGSYYLALALMGTVLVVLYPRFLKSVAALSLLGAMTIPIFPEPAEKLWVAISSGYERRAEEVDVGLDGQIVYRQEFYAEEYLSRNIGVALTGVGIGRANTVLHNEFGDGAGYNGDAPLPLNSAVLQILFDLGGPAILIIYGTLLALIWRAWRRREIFLMLVLVLLGMQSLSIQVLQFMAIFMGAALARMPSRQPKLSVFPRPPLQTETHEARYPPYR